MTGARTYRWMALGFLSLGAGLVAGLCASATLLLPGASTMAAPAPTLQNSQATRTPTPVDQFRAMLAMDKAGWEKALASRPEPQRSVLRAKLIEYGAMPAEECELRLRALELRFHLEPLMKVEPAQRTALLARVPEDLRPLVEERLTQWDLLPPDLRKEALESQLARNYFARVESSTPPEPRNDTSMDRPPTPSEIEQQLARWRQVPTARRIQEYHRFDRFFELTDAEKARILQTLPEGERQQMEGVLSTFKALPREQRQYCIESFHKFTSMPAVEREQFLDNAARWQSLAPEERKAWRELVTALPPLPPGMIAAPPIQWPPVPQGFPAPSVQ